MSTPAEKPRQPTPDDGTLPVPPKTPMSPTATEGVPPSAGSRIDKAIEEGRLQPAPVRSLAPLGGSSGTLKPLTRQAPAGGRTFVSPTVEDLTTKTETGADAQIPYNRKAATKALRDDSDPEQLILDMRTYLNDPYTPSAPSVETPGGLDEYKNQTEGGRFFSTLEGPPLSDIREGDADDPLWWKAWHRITWSGATMLEPFAIPGRLARNKALAGMSWLPNTGTPLGDAGADATGWLLQKVAGGWLGGPLGALTSKAIGYSGGYPDERTSPLGSEEARAQVWNEVGKRLYSVVASGELMKDEPKYRDYTAILDTPLTDNPVGRWFGLGPVMHNVRGTDILDHLLSKEEAEQAASTTAPASGEGLFFNLASSDGGRAVLGAALDIATDPLLLLGVADGSQLVEVGEATFRVGPDITRAAASMAETGGVREADALKILVRAAHNDEAARRAAGESIAMLREQAGYARGVARAVAEADTPEEALAAIRPYIEGGNPIGNRLRPFLDTWEARLARGASAEDVMKAAVRVTDSIGREFDVAAYRVGRALEGANVSRAGGVAFHVPFGERTYYPLAGTFDRLGAQVTQLTKPAWELIPDFAEMSRRVSEQGMQSLTAGEKLAYISFHANRLATLGAQIPLMAWDFIARHLGGRIFQPLFADLSRLNVVSKDAKALREVVGSETLRSAIRRIKRVSPEVWSAYQQAAVRLVAQRAARASEIRHAVSRMTDAAKRALVVEKSMGRTGRTVNDILLEVASARDRGLGEFPAELRPYLDEVNAAIQDITKGDPNAEAMAQQAAVAMMREMQGDPHAFKEMVAFLTKHGEGEVRRLMHGSDFDEAFMAATGAWAGLLRQTQDVMRARPEALARVLDNTIKVLGGRSASDKEMAGIVEAMLDDAFKNSPKLAAQVKIGIKAMTGASSVGEGLASLARRVVAREGPGEPIVQVLRRMGQEAEEKKHILVDVLTGVATPEQQRRALAAMLNDNAARALSNSRALAPVEWGLMVRAAGGDADALVEVAQALPRGLSDVQRTMTARRAAQQAARAIASMETSAEMLHESAYALGQAEGAVGARRLLAGAVERNVEKLKALLPAGATANRVQDVADITKLHLSGLASARDVEARMREIDAAHRVARAEVREGRKVLEATRPTLPAVKRVPLPPHLEGPNGRRYLLEWEKGLHERVMKATDGLNPDEIAVVIMATLRDQKLLPKDIPGIEDLQTLYPHVLGNRYGDLPPHLAEVKREVDSFLDSEQALLEHYGFKFVLSKEELIKKYGVANYTPHMQTTSSLTARARLKGALEAERGGGNAAPGGALYNLLSTKMDARKKRELIGAIDEINAMVQAVEAGPRVDYIYAGLRTRGFTAPTTDMMTARARAGAAPSAPNIEFGFSPDAILMHAGQVNRATSAVEMLWSFLHSGVARQFESDGTRSAAALAAEAGYMPLLSRPNARLDADVILFGQAEDLRRMGIGPEALANEAMIYQEPHIGLAAWNADIPLIEQAHRIEANLVGIRAAQAEAGEALLDLHQLVGEHGFEDAAALFTRAALDHGFDFHITGHDLEAYLGAGGAARTYLPASVVQGMNDLLDVNRWANTAQGPRDFFDKVASFWKARLTAVNIAFTMGNAYANELASLVDVGPFGFLNPRTHYQATQATIAMGMKAKYGSLFNAAERVAMDTVPGESRWEWLARMRDRALWESSGLDGWIMHGVDVGDGVVRHGDEVVDLLARHNIATDAYSTFADAHHYHSTLMDMMASTDAEQAWQITKKAASMAEDIAYGTITTAISGGIPVVVPKGLGRSLAQFVENRSRIANAFANLRRSASWEDAAAHVAKFLFNYEDLTAFQKVWMRSFQMFFTWPFKNIELHMKLAKEHPMLMSLYWRTLFEDIPYALKAAQAEAEGDYTPPNRPADEASQYLLDEHERFKARLPLPGLHDAYISGMRLPIESALETASMYSDTIEGILRLPAGTRPKPSALRLLSTVNPAISLLLQWAMKRHFYYNKALEDTGTSTRTATALIDGFDQWKDTPVVGSLAGGMAQYLRDWLQYATVSHLDPRTGRVVKTAHANPERLLLLNGLPWRQGLMNAAAVSDAAHVDLISAGDEIGAVGTSQPIPMYLRVMDAEMGINIGQLNDAYRAKVVGSEGIDAAERALQERGTIRPSTESYVPK